MFEFYIENQIRGMSTVTELKNIYRNLVLLRGLQVESEAEWGNLFDANTQEHLVEGVRLSSTKSDAIRTYIAKMMAIYTRTGGITSTAWTKYTLCKDNSTNIAIINKITSELIKEGNQLFKLVATRLMGYDDLLVDAALEPINEELHLTNYLVGKFNLNEISPEDQETLLPGTENYPELVELFKAIKETPITDNTLLEMYDYVRTCEGFKADQLLNPLDMLVEAYNGVTE